VDADNFKVMFYVDGSFVTKKLYKQSCEKVDTHRSDGLSVKKVNPLDVMDGTADDPNAAELGIGDLTKIAEDNKAKAASFEGDVSREFKFRPRWEYRNAFSSFVIGGLYCVYTDVITQPFQGTMDQVAYYGEGIPAGRCSLPVSKPVLKALMVSALENII